MNDDRLLTVAEAAEEFFLPQRTIRTWIGRGFLKWRHDGLISEAEVAHLEEKTRRVARTGHLLAQAGVVESSSVASTAIPQPGHSALKVQK